MWLVNHSGVEMKVTVCFGSVRVLVPCGAGDLLVRDLVREATLRYKKATGQVSLSPSLLICFRAVSAAFHWPIRLFMFIHG